MGGSALKSLEIGVIPIESREEWLRVASEYVEYLKQYYKRVEIARKVEWKTRFGDIDLLVSGEISPIPFDPARMLRRGNTLHVAHRFHDSFVQIDIEHIQERDFDFIQFAHFGDMVMIFGPLLKKHHMTFRANGLYLRDNLSKHMILTQDPERVIQYLGLPCSSQELFKCQSESEFFKLLMQSKYTPELRWIFDVDTVRNKSWRRQMKKMRPVVTSFAAFITTNVELSPVDFSVHTIQSAVEFFNFTVQYEKLRRVARHNQITREHYTQRLNGERIMQITGLERHQLGKLIKQIKEKFTVEQIIAMSIEEIDRKIMEILSLRDN